MRILLSDNSDGNQPDDTVLNTSKHIPPYCYCDKPACSNACESIDVQELSWPVESKVVSIMTFCKERWQVKHKNKPALQQKYTTIG